MSSERSLIRWMPTRAGTLSAWVIACFACLMCGCQLTPAPNLVPCPLPATEQVHKVLEITPLGTPRDEAVKALEKAGFAGGFGSNQSIYYCDIWDHGEGERWHMNVMLLFDDDGKLYATRPDASGSDNPTPRLLEGKPDTATTIDPFQSF